MKFSFLRFLAIAVVSSNSAIFATASTVAPEEIKVPALRSAWMIREGLAEYSSHDSNLELVRHFDKIIEMLESDTATSIDSALSKLIDAGGLANSCEQILAIRESLEESRLSNIKAVKAYRDRGQFPINNRSEKPVPIFVDDRGTRCAVGYLIHCSGRDEIVAHVENTDNGIYLDGALDAVVSEWIQLSGLTQRELALIQPGYGPTCTNHQRYFENGESPGNFGTFFYGGLNTAQAVFDFDPSIGSDPGSFSLSDTADIGLAFGGMVNNPILPFYYGLANRPDYGPLMWGAGDYLVVGSCGGLRIFTGTGSGTLKYDTKLEGFFPDTIFYQRDRRSIIHQIVTKSDFAQIRLDKNFAGYIIYTTRVYSHEDTLLGSISFDSRDPGTIVPLDWSSTQDEFVAEDVINFDSQLWVKISVEIEIVNPDSQSVSIDSLIFGVGITHVEEHNMPITFVNEAPKKGTIIFESDEGVKYLLQKSENLGSSYQIIDSLTGTGTALSFGFDDSATQNDSGYYRVLQLPENLEGRPSP